MRVLLFGSRGYIGQEFLKAYPDADVPSIDIADPVLVRETLDAAVPDVVINAAGKTGRPNVDWCEDHKQETLRSNVTGPLVLLEECAKRGIFLAHLGSGCIYEGDSRGRGFTEDDLPNFTGSFYARTKAWADQMLKDFPNVLVLRLRMPFDASQSDRNLIMKLRRYTRVLDVKNSITSIPDFLSVARVLIERKASGIFNIVNPDPISPYHIMELYRDIVDPGHSFERLTLEELPAVTRAGRSNCVLSTEKIESLRLHLRPAEEAVKDALSGLRESLRH